MKTNPNLHNPHPNPKTETVKGIIGDFKTVSCAFNPETGKWTCVLGTVQEEPLKLKIFDGTKLLEGLDVT